MRQDVTDGSRSSLFLFMVKHHADLVGEGHSGRMPWIKLCKRFAKDGLVDGHGQTPTPKRAGKTWREACEEVRRLAAVYPRAAPIRSRPAGSWRPVASASASPKTVQAAPSRREPPSPLPTPEGEAPTSGPFGSNPSVEEQIAEVRRQLAANDRKRFGSM